MSISKCLSDYLIKLNKLEKLNESIRQAIGSNPYFQTLSVFERFDKFKKGYLIASDFSQFMLQNELYPTQSQLYIIFKDFDKKRMGVVSLQGFQDQILPRQNQNLKKQIIKRKPYPAQPKLSIDLQFILKKYFESKMKFHRQLQVLRLKMKTVNIYSVQQSFLLLDQNRVGFLSKIQQIDKFLRKNGYALRVQDLVRIYKSLNFKRVDQITFQRFQQHLMPFEKGFYPGYKQRMIQKQYSKQFLVDKSNYVQRQIQSRSRTKVEICENIANLQTCNKILQNVIKQQDYTIDLSRQRLDANQILLKSHYLPYLPKYYY